MTAESIDCPLSERQLEIIGHLANGDQLEVVARRLFLARNTVKTHLQLARDKLGVREARTSAGMVALCLRNGWIT